MDKEMTWNHRVVRKVYEHEVLFGIHEVFNFSHTDAKMITINPVDVCGESVEELKETLDWMQKALEQPVLEYSDFEEGGKYYFEDEDEA